MPDEEKSAALEIPGVYCNLSKLKLSEKPTGITFTVTIPYGSGTRDMLPIVAELVRNGHGYMALREAQARLPEQEGEQQPLDGPVGEGPDPFPDWPAPTDDPPADAPGADDMPF